MEIRQGAVIGSRYRVQREIGRGSMGTVYLAEDLFQVHPRVALKIIRPDRVTGSRLDQFRRECTMMSRLRHPNLARFYEFGFTEVSGDGHDHRNGDYYLAFEYIEGRDLVTYFQQSDRSVDTVCKLACQICRALQYIHTLGLVHLDVKPSNIMIQQTGDYFDIKLIDFGLAAMISSLKKPLIRGSAPYMAPELIRQRKSDHRADLYSLGITLYEMIAGCRPFDSEEISEIFQRHIAHEPEPLREKTPWIPETLHGIIMRLLEKKPADRYADANAVIHDLGTLPGGECKPESPQHYEYSGLSPVYIGQHEQLDRVLELSETPGSQGIAVTGPAGAGKTRFTKELRRREGFNNGILLSGTCRIGTGRILEPFHAIIYTAAHWIDVRLRSEPTHKGWRLLQHDAVSLIGYLSGTSKETNIQNQKDLILRFADFFYSLSRIVPMILIIEDLHQSDPFTLKLVQAVFRSLLPAPAQSPGRGSETGRMDHPLTVLVTCRRDELPDAADFLLNAMDSGTVEEVMLSPLSGADIEACIHSAFGAMEQYRKLVTHLERTTAGNPLFIQEMLEAYLRRGIVRIETGLWVVDPEKLGVMEPLRTVEQAIGARLDQLSGPARQIIEILSIALHPVERAMIQNITGIGPEEVEISLDSMLRKDLLAESMGSRGNRYSIVHDLIRNTVLSRMQTVDRRRMHQAVAAYLAAHEPSSAVRDEIIARHLLAVESRDAIPYVISAVENLVNQTAYEIAEDLLDRALALHPDLDDYQSLLTLKVKTIHQAGHFPACLRALEDLKNRLKEHHRDIPFDLAVPEALCHRSLGHHDRALALAESILEKIDPEIDRQVYLRCSMIKIQMLLYTGNMSDAEALLDSVCQEIITTGESSRTAGRFLHNCTHFLSEMMLSGTENLDKMEKLEQAAYRILSQHGYKEDLVLYYSGAASIQMYRENLSEAARLCRKAIRLCAGQGWKVSEMTNSVTLAMIYEQQARFREAFDIALKAMHFFQRHRFVTGEAKVKWILGNLCGCMQQVDEGEAYLREALEMFEAANNPYMAARVHMNIGVSRTANYDFEGALESLLDTRDRFRQHGEQSAELTAAIFMTYAMVQLNQYNEIHSMVADLMPKALETRDNTIIIALRQTDAITWFASGHYQKALKLLEGIMNDAESKGLLQFQVGTAFYILRIYTLSGRYGDALMLRDRLMENLSRIRMENRFQFYIVLSEFLVALNDRKAARETLHQFNRFISRFFPGNAHYRAELWRLKAMAFSAGREFRRAVNASHRALDYANRTQMTALIRQSAVNCARMQVLDQQYSNAEKVLKKYRDILETHPLPDEKCRIAAIQGIIDRELNKDLEKSTALFLESLDHVSGDIPREQVWQLYDELARNAEMQGETALVEQYLNAAEAVIEAIEAEIPPERLSEYRARWERVMYDERRLEHRRAAVTPELPDRNSESVDTSFLNTVLFKLLAIVTDSARNPEVMIQKFLYEIITVFGAGRGILFLRSGIEMPPGVSPETIDLIPRMALDSRNRIVQDITDTSRSVPRDVMHHRKPVVITGNVPGTASMDAYDLRSVMCVPIETARNPVGVLYIDSTADIRRFNETDLQRLETICRHLALHLENTRLWEEKLQQETSRRRALEQEVRQLRETLSPGREMIGQSPAFIAFIEHIRKVAGTRASVLLTGETGTGKESAAHAIHNGSSRRDRPFVVIDCTSIPENLLESELFGHEKGAFTSAVQRKAGKFEIADTGTVFLDEIGDLPMGLQGKLLRVIEEKTFERVGGTRRIQADIRFVAATNRDLEIMVREGQFRSDLYFRLNVVSLRIPPLRERNGDIERLAHHFLTQFTGEYQKPIQGFSPEATRAMNRYTWPGNIRELIHRIQRGVILTSKKQITLEDLALPGDVSRNDPTGEILPVANGGESLKILGPMIDELIHQAAQDSAIRIWPDVLPEIRMQAVLETLRWTDGNKTRAADFLRIERRKVSRILTKKTAHLIGDSETEWVETFLTAIRDRIERQWKDPGIRNSCILEEIEDEMIRRALEYTRQNHEKTRKLLVISRYMLNRKLNNMDSRKNGRP